MGEVRIGVYICHCGTNIAGVVDVEEVRKYVEGLPGVVLAKTYPYMCSDPGQNLIKEDIEKGLIDRVVVAACSPRLHEPTFRRVLREAGLNPYLLEMANIREQCSWVHMREPKKATEKAKDIIRMTVAKARLLSPLQPVEVPARQEVLVIGGGIAGITAALDLANAGFRVYLVERAPSIGGHMAQLDKTFPTMDCSQCILTPRMVDVARHPNVQLFTNSEVVGVEGFAGNFKVKVLKKPYYVDLDKCTGCGLCVDFCPIEVPSEFDVGMAPRKAIYIPFPQAIPHVAVIDPEHCLYFMKKKCMVCEEVCQELAAGAIDFSQQPEEVELDVGTIIVATGYDLYDPTQDEEYGYGRYEDVITALQMERLLSASGPTRGEIVRPSDKEKPKKVAYIQCVGSRSLRPGHASYCSRVCCMYAIKQALQLKEKYPDIDVCIFYIDLRTFGRGYEEFYWRAQEHGVRFIRGKVAEIWRSRNGRLVVRAEDTLTGRVLEEEFDMVVLSAGLRPSKGTEELAALLKIPLGPDGFFLEAHPKLRPVDTVVDGIFVCGTATGPKDIVDTVAQAKAAASSAMALLSRGKIVIEPFVAAVDEDRCRGCGRCEEVCEFGAVAVEEKDGRLVAHVNEALCKGCGACSVRCPTGAIKVRNFRPEQIRAMVSSVAG
ncbi:disulfide reductase [Candidatus Bathyarchaeota archaeon ex4484_135]|nr:MAG: disulfide reductase [Candidatus Bathyarchaeota archaeon ex4484_135]